MSKRNSRQIRSVDEVKAMPAEFVNKLGVETYRAAYSAGMSLSAYLEREMPSDTFKDGMDAFERLLMLADIRVNSLDNEQGVMADPFERFFETPQTRALLPEWMRRVYKRGQGLPVNTRSLYSSADQYPGQILNPWSDAAGVRDSLKLAPQIPINEIVALTTPIDTDTYRALYMTDSAANQRMVRVTEFSDIPKAKLTQSQNTIRLYKYGRALEASYEMLRRQPIDRIAYHIMKLAVQAEIDKLAAIIDVIVNGDGNANSATNHNLLTLDADTTSGVLTVKGFLAFKMKFLNPYALTHVLVQEAEALKLILLNTGSANLPTSTIPTVAVNNITGFEVINPTLRTGTRLGVTSDAVANKVIGIDSRFCIERVTEIGSTISEVEKVIGNQTQLITMTENEGYAVLDANANKTLTLNA